MCPGIASVMTPVRIPIQNGCVVTLSTSMVVLEGAVGSRRLGSGRSVSEKKGATNGFEDGGPPGVNRAPCELERERLNANFYVQFPNCVSERSTPTRLRVGHS